MKLYIMVMQNYNKIGIVILFIIKLFSVYYCIIILTYNMAIQVYINQEQNNAFTYFFSFLF